MLIFWIICALLVLLALWFVLPAFVHPDEQKKSDEPRAANLLVYQNQYQELEADLKNGLIAQEQYQQEKDELERRVLDDVKTESTDSPGWLWSCRRHPDCRGRLVLCRGHSQSALSVGDRQPNARARSPTRRRALAAADGSQCCQTG